jgi:hypothetical protein
MKKLGYEAPTLSVVGTIHELTLTRNKYETKTPDGVLFHPATGPAVPLSS